MPDAVTTTSAVTLTQTAWDRRAYFALRPQLFFDRMASVQPTNQSMPGSSVTFTIMSDIPAATTPLSETTDVNAVALSDNTVTVTLAEYGNAVMTSAKLRGTSFVPVDPIVANVIGFNSGLSIDTIARDNAFGGTVIDFANAAHATVATTASGDNLKAQNVRYEVTQLRNNFVMDFDGYYTAYAHPDVIQDLRSESGSGAWRTPHEYQSNAEIWNGEVGLFEGVRWITTPRAKYAVNAGAGAAITVYSTLFCGQEGIAKTYSQQDGNGPAPRIVFGPVTDHLRRLVPVGWYWLGGYGLFRTPALRLVKSAATNNAQA